MDEMDRWVDKKSSSLPLFCINEISTMLFHVSLTINLTSRDVVLR